MAKKVKTILNIYYQSLKGVAIRHLNDELLNIFKDKVVK